MSTSIDQYKDNTYLEKTGNWHADESDWKFEQMRPLLDSIDFDTVADVGCGAGKIIENVAENYPVSKAVGYDITPNVKQFWTERTGEVEYREQNILDTKDEYDLLLLIDVFEHVENYYQFLRDLKEHSRYFIFHIPLDLFAIALITNNLDQKKESVGHLHYFTKNSALSVLEDCGYKVREYNYTNAYAVSNTKLNKKSKLIRTVMEKILGKDLNSKVTGGYSLMVLAEKA